ncbi:hypothetical protein NVT68_010970 [Clostridium botulinum]|uniref:hypothetical protein n=1 Tax=Clostridium TaxID=1485 RepID=UPI000BB49430|nr:MULTISPECIES: hypothetical protein [Clostridium]MDI6920152.1 hypothetical protein [Clostridium botulinum]
MIILILIIPILFIYYPKVHNKINNINKYIHVYDVVKEAFITDGGYSNKLSKHISEEVFKKINIYNNYAIML